ncbi:MAG TPA: sigma-54 dependent transcriptional regulator [Thermoanaerobaculia bacterium]|nr:sigma-54 dependent transcriptional regulator [Thermoanaerobaculia bacterium]
MSCLLVIGTTAEVSSFRQAAPEPATQCAFVDWQQFRPEMLRERTERLVVIFASGADGELCRWLRLHPIPQAILAIFTGELHVELLETVDDFLLWPATSAELQCRIERLMHGLASDSGEVCRKLLDELAVAQLVGSEPCFVETIRQLALFARSEMPILITGETGTGKELCARAAHFLSARRNGPFVAVDCSAIPDHLFENEMFGHARGAYTDARAEQKGLATLSEHGTLFLDEVDSLSLAAQRKLLRFLQEKTFKPLGGEKFLHADVTVLAATNRDLAQTVATGAFRSDLYYRLNVLQVCVPPLRERRGDVNLLARHFLESACARMQHRKTFSPQTLHKLTMYDWPGNVRELMNLVQRAAIVAEGDVVLPCHVPLPGFDVAEEEATFRSARAKTLEIFERAYVRDMLAKHDGNVSRAARAAGKERRAFGRLVKKYNLARGSVTTRT